MSAVDGVGVRWHLHDGQQSERLEGAVLDAVVQALHLREQHAQLLRLLLPVTQTRSDTGRGRGEGRSAAAQRGRLPEQVHLYSSLNMCVV